MQDLPKCISISRKVKRKTHLEKMLISLKSVCVCVCVRERDRETERQRDRERESDEAIEKTSVKQQRYC